MFIFRKQWFFVFLKENKTNNKKHRYSAVKGTEREMGEGDKDLKHNRFSPTKSLNICIYICLKY